MGYGKRLNYIEKGQIEAFKDLNLSVSEIYRMANGKNLNSDGPDGFKYYWLDVRGPKKHFFKEISVMVWAAISSRGSSEFVFLEGKQNSSKYIETLDQYWFLLCDKFRNDAVIFQNHTSKKDWQSFLQERNLKVLKWPARSPDLNPIENMQGLLARKVYSNGKQYSSVQELKEALNKACKELDEKSLKPFLDSLKNRVEELIIKKGGKIHYWLSYKL